MTVPVRKPYVAGSFYPADSSALKEFLTASLKPISSLSHAKAVILPHAGYEYSGKTTAEVLKRTAVPSHCFLIGPNHRGAGYPFALFPEGSWETPLGPVPVDREFTSGLLESSHDLRADLFAHEREHSLEVIIPFLQFRNPAVKIAPLVIGTLDLDWSRQAAFSLLEFLKTYSNFLIVVSTDMSHYETEDTARRKDQHALRAIETLDEEKLVQVVENHQITMCGFVPVFLSLILVKGLGARKASLVDYRTSAEANGDKRRVVGYAGFIIE